MNEYKKLEEEMIVKYESAFFSEQNIKAAFEMAWDLGHSSGDEEIKGYMMDLMNLVAKIKNQDIKI